MLADVKEFFEDFWVDFINFSFVFLTPPPLTGAFICSQQKEIRSFFDKHGFVCVRNVLNDAEIGATLDEFFARFDRNDADSIEKFFDQQQVCIGDSGVERWWRTK